MSEPLLSSEETDALLAAMRQGDDESAIEGVDLTSPERRIRAALPIADKAGVEVAQLMRRLMLRHAGTPAATESEPAEINPYSVIVSGLRPGSAVARLRIGESFGFLTFGPKLVSFLLDRQLGAPLRMDAEQAASGARERLTAVEKRVLGPIVAEFCSDVSEAFCGDAEVIRTLNIESDTSELPELDPYEPVLRLCISVNPGVAPADEVMLVFASSAVTIAFGQPEAQAEIVSPTERDRMRQRVDAADVEVAAILGRAKTTVSAVLRLAIGDVLRLDGVPGEPCNIVAAGVTVLRGKPVTQHGNLAVEITTTTAS